MNLLKLLVWKDEILCVSGKTGEGVKELMDAIVERIPSPKVLMIN